MVDGSTDYVDVFIVAILWGCTNPFLRKGTYEEDEKLRIQQEQLQKQQEEEQQAQHWKQTSSNEEGSMSNSCGIVDENSCETSLTPKTMATPNRSNNILHGDYEGKRISKSTYINNKTNVLKYPDNDEFGYSTFPILDEVSASRSEANNSDQNYFDLYQESTIEQINKNATSAKISEDRGNMNLQQCIHREQQYEDKIPTSYAKGIFLQCLSKCCCFCNEYDIQSEPNKILEIFANFHPKHIMKQFISSIIYELSKFTKPKIAIPFLFNQCSAIFYYKIIATSALTNVAYCGAMSMAIEGIVSYVLGERMSHPLRGFGGALVVTLGVSICLFSDDIETYLFGNADDGGVDNNINPYYFNQEQGYNDRQLVKTDDENHQDNEFVFNDLREGSTITSLFEISPFVCWYALCGVLHSFLSHLL